MPNPIVVFDVGGVLVPFTDQAAEVARQLEVTGLTDEQVEAAYWTDREAWDNGGADGSYWAGVAAELGRELRPGQVEELTRHDCVLWTRIRPTARETLAQLHAAGTVPLVLSNAPAPFRDALDHAAWRRLVGEMFISGELQMSKPHGAIFHHVTARLEADPADIHFIDDRQVNVDGAQSAGWNAHLWTDDADTRQWLVGLGLV